MHGKISWLFSGQLSALIYFSGRHRRRWKKKKQWGDAFWCNAKVQPGKRLSIVNSMSESAHFFEFCHVFHHSHDRDRSAQQWHHQNRDLETGSRSVAAIWRKVGV